MVSTQHRQRRPPWDPWPARRGSMWRLEGRLIGCCPESPPPRSCHVNVSFGHLRVPLKEKKMPTFVRRDWFIP